jgi:hypothetical protein
MPASLALVVAAVLAALPAAAAAQSPNPNDDDPFTILPALDAPAATVIAKPGPDLPARNRTVKPGEQLTLAIDRKGERTVALVRVTAKGTPIRTVKRARTKYGVFLAKLPMTPRAYYAVRVGKDEGFYLYAQQGPELKLFLDRNQALRGETVGTVLRNTGDVPITTGYGGTFEALTPSGWVRPQYQGDPAPAIAIGLRPGQEVKSSIRVPTELSPGVHRIVGWGRHDASRTDADLAPSAQLYVG